MEKKYALSIIFCLLLIPGWAQKYKMPKLIGVGYAGLSFAQPLGQFKKTYPGMQAFGGTIGFLFDITNSLKSPLSVGLEGNYLVYGISRLKVNNPNDAYTIRTTHEIIPLHALVRLKPRWNTQLIPYIDGLAGITVFKTISKMKIPGYDGEESLPVLGKYRETGLSYGFAGGVHLKLDKDLSANLRLVYLQNPINHYIKRKDVTAGTDGYPVYKISHSETNTVQVQLNLVGSLLK